MLLEFPCETCRQTIRTRHLRIGEQAQCKACGALTTVPANARLGENDSEDRSSAGSAAPGIPLSMTTTTFSIDGYRTVRNVGLVRGLTVRSRSVLGAIGAEFQTLVGGKITVFIDLCEQTREEALSLMLAHALEAGANAVVGVHYDTTELADGVTEVICYGTGVLLEEIPRKV